MSVRLHAHLAGQFRQRGGAFRQLLEQISFHDGVPENVAENAVEVTEEIAFRHEAKPSDVFVGVQ